MSSGRVFICDGCEATEIKPGRIYAKNQKAPTVPDGWARLRVTDSENVTRIAELCPKCFDSVATVLAGSDR